MNVATTRKGSLCRDSGDRGARPFSSRRTRPSCRGCVGRDRSPRGRVAHIDSCGDVATIDEVSVCPWAERVFVVASANSEKAKEMTEILVDGVARRRSASRAAG